MAAKFEIYEDSNQEWRFNLKAPNGEIIAASEGYSSKANARKGVASVRRYAGEASLFEDGNQIEPEEKLIVEQTTASSTEKEQPPEPEEKRISYEWK